MVKESTLQRSIQKAIEDAGGKVYKIHGGPYSVAGAPDLIGSIDGKPFAIEVKLPGKKKTLTAKQAYELEQWAKQGWNVGVATTVEEAKTIVYIPHKLWYHES
jgi:Holliday junction resolvase